MILTVTLNAAIDKRYEVEQFKTDAVNRVKQCIFSAGGKGLNVSRAAVIAGEQVTATGFVGGHTGMLIEALAKEDGICTDFVHIPEESRTCINILDTVTGSQTEFLEGGFFVSPQKAREMAEKYEELLPKAKAVAISGSTPRGIGSSMYAKMIQKARKAGIPVLLDTSGSLLLEGVKELPVLIKPNEDEIVQLTGSKISSQRELTEAGERLVEQGIRYVVISQGAQGSLLISREGIWKARVPKLKAVNTVGCGDSMLAGFAIGISRQWTEPKMLAYASAISAANALRQETGYYKKEDYETLYPQIQIEQIK